MLSIAAIAAFLLLGSFVGLMAGLLGVSGGGIMVSMLTSIFLAQGMPVESVVHLALGTSMASMMMSSFSSLRAHNAKGAVVWDAVKGMSPGIILGAFLATFVAAQLNATFLAVFFALFMLFVASQIVSTYRPTPSRELAGSGGLFLVGTGIGAVSALVTVGGGFLTVAYLTWQNVDIKKSIGTSSTIAFPIAIAGTLGYLINGWSNSSMENHTLGFIYLPAVLLMSITSFLLAPVGVRLAHALPVSMLKKLFAMLLVLLSIQMLISVMG